MKSHLGGSATLLLVLLRCLALAFAVEVDSHGSSGGSSADWSFVAARSSCGCAALGASSECFLARQDPSRDCQAAPHEEERVLVRSMWHHELLEQRSMSWLQKDMGLAPSPSWLSSYHATHRPQALVSAACQEDQRAQQLCRQDRQGRRLLWTGRPQPNPNPTSMSI